MRAADRRRSVSGAYWLPLALAASFPLAAVGWARAQLASPAPVPAQPAHAELALPPLFSPEIQRWTGEIQRWAIGYGLPAELIATVMQIESCGHPAVESSAGALGLFQVMPYHFAAGEQVFAPEVNAHRGLGYLARSLELAAGDRRLALAGYNGGHGVIARPESSWPAETRRYVDWAMGILGDVDRGLAISPALQAWLEAGGHSLCRRAAAYLQLD